MKDFRFSQRKMIVMEGHRSRFERRKEDNLLKFDGKLFSFSYIDYELSYCKNDNLIINYDMMKAKDTKSM